MGVNDVIESPIVQSAMPSLASSRGRGLVTFLSQKVAELTTAGKILNVRESRSKKKKNEQK
jgi:hypothetical protein